MNRESRRSHEPHVVTQPGRDKPRQWVEEAGIIEENNSMKRNQHSARWAVTMLREEDQVVRSPSVPQGQPPYSSRAATQGSTRNQPLPPSPPPCGRRNAPSWDGTPPAAVHPPPDPAADAAAAARAPTARVPNARRERYWRRASGEEGDDVGGVAMAPGAGCGANSAPRGCAGSGGGGGVKAKGR